MSRPGDTASAPTAGSTAPRRSPQAEAVVSALAARSIVLVGLMGCGKTSVGRRLSAKLGIGFFDSDAEIELAHRKSIPEIFEDYGEPYFRNGEKRVIARLLKSGPQVLATGGGAFMNEETRAAVRADGISVWLKADLPLLMRRVAKRSNRPLLKAADPEAVMRGFIEKRYPVYAEADVTVESRDVPHDVMADTVIAALLKSRLFPPATAGVSTS
jgi:shikimate kinase